MRPAFALPLFALLTACAAPSPRIPVEAPPAASAPPPLSSPVMPSAATPVASTASAPPPLPTPAMPSSGPSPVGTPGNLWCYEVGNAPARIAPGCKSSLADCEVVLAEARRGAVAEGLGDPFSGCRAIRSEEMTRPHRLSGNMPIYSRAAREANAQGMVIAQCTVTVEGRLEDCKIIKSLPLMDQAVLDALLTWQFEPIQFMGRAARTSYLFPMKFALR